MKPVLVDLNQPNYVVDKTTGAITVHPRSQLLQLNDATQGRVKAFNRLRHELAAACEFYQNVGDDGKFGASLAIRAVTTFLESQGVPIAAHTPLSDLEIALGEAKNGIPNALTKVVAKGKGRPQRGLRDETRLGILAAAAEFFWLHGRREGWSLDQSCRLAAKEINSAKMLGRVTAKSLKLARDQVRQMPSIAHARSYYDELMDNSFRDAIPLELGQMLASHGFHVFAKPKSD